MIRFVQELDQDSEGEPHIQWRGYIQYIQGNNEERFTDLAEAVAFIQQRLTELTITSLTRDERLSQERVFQESFKLWERFSSSYTNVMVRAMEQSLKQSETFTDHVDKATQQAIQVWTGPAQQRDGDIMEQLHQLQIQIKTLGDRVEQLEQALTS
jgi:hypothetical protein